MAIRRLLVANRGEIARRVFATCRRLGIETVAVHSDADAGLPFVREADAAVRLPGNAPSDTYLRADLVIEAARRTGADALHPGYGFLSENADFARQVIAAGLTWLGPAPESIEAMGSKVEAKKLMEAAGVPVLQSVSPDAATEADLPLVVKASAGGGGRGMRVVRQLGDLSGQVRQAADEALSAFGDATVFVEPYVERGRHVEVQVLGDRFGDVLVLGERDCSIQRRHQKVVEEAPAPAIAPDVVAQMHRAARDAARAIDYLGAGTVEFLYDPEREQFWFLEMNTRLQVEHPVTEAVTGLDLVELQVAVAEGRPVPEPVTPRGHAIEVRLYAEDPTHDWQPQSGRLTTFEIPGVTADFDRTASAGVRVDSGFESGSEVSTHYDAMLAKVIAWSPTRAGAARMLADALSRARLHGVVTNRDLLVGALRHEAFLDGRVSTDFLDRHGPVATAAAAPDHHLLLAAAVALAEEAKRAARVQAGIPVGWRSVVSQPHRTVFEVHGKEHPVDWYAGRDGYRAAAGDARVLAASPTGVTLDVDGISFRVGVTLGPETATGRPVYVDGPLGSVALRTVPRFLDPADQVASGSLLAPMPGTVVRVDVTPGQQVDNGQPVLVLEAMKMQHTVKAPQDGVVVDVPVKAGDQVAAGAVLAVIDEATEGESA